MNFTHEELKVMQEAIDHYGEESQLDMAIEEMSELTKAICKCKRLDKEYIKGELFWTEYEPKAEKAIGNVAEEIADVYIMLEQLTMIFNCKERVSAIAREKMRRLKGRIDNDV